MQDKMYVMNHVPDTIGTTSGYVSYVMLLIFTTQINRIILAFIQNTI